MEETARGERLAAALEQEFQDCHNLLTGTMAGVMRQGSFEDWQLRNMLALMKTAAQLAATISRVEKLPPQKNIENRGSIPQENCG